MEVHPDFPRPGVTFYSCRGLLESPTTRNKVFGCLASRVKSLQADKVLGVDSRGYILGTALATSLELPFGMITKLGKTPGEVVSTTGQSEYGSSSLEVSSSLVTPGLRVVIVDDVLATGGTALAAASLVTRLGGVVVGFVFVGFVVSLHGDITLKSSYPEASVDYYYSLTPDGVITSWTDVRPTWSPPNTLASCPYVVLAHPSMYSWASWLTSHYPGVFGWAEVKWNSFPDSMPDVEFPAKLLRGRKVVYVMSSDDPSTLFEQWSLMRAITKHFPSQVWFWLPYFSVGTHERTTLPGTLATAKTMMELLSCGIASCSGGPPQLVVADIHSLVERFYLSNEVIFNPVDPVPDVIKFLGDGFTVVLPDDGAFKRAKPSLVGTRLPVVTFDKHRSGSTRDVVWNPELSLNGPPNYRYAVILDDVCMSGGTLVEVAKALLRMGFQAVSAYITHARFPGNSWRRLVAPGPDAVFHTVYCMDTVTSTVETIRDRKPFFVISSIPGFIKELLPSDIDTTVIRLGTEQKVKVDAVTRAFETIYPTRRIRFRLYAAKSGVSSQPIGKEEILKGLQGREYSVGYPSLCIESGLVIEDGKGYDVPAVSWQGRVVWGEGREVAPDVVARVLEAKGSLTIGECVDPSNPHACHLDSSPKSREQILFETVYRMLN